MTQFKPDLAARSATRLSLGVEPDTPLIGLIARFDPLKNHEGFVEAAARVNRSSPSARFLLAGTGVDWDNNHLSSLIESFGLKDRFLLLGRRSDVADLLAALDVSVSPSWGEGFPNAIGEAMACGLPCVVTDVGDCRELVADTGFTVPTGDMTQLAERIVDLLTMPLAKRQSMGEQARLRIERKFLLSTIIREYESLYRACIEEREM